MAENEKAKTETQKAKASKLKPAHAAAIVIIVAAVIGVFYITTVGAGSPTVVQNGDNVSVYYTGKFSNGTVFDSNVGRQTLNFTVGSGQLIKGFDNAVVGMSINQTKNITLTPSEAYGSINQSLIITVPKADFGNNSNVSIGMVVTTSSGARGLVTKLNTTNAIINFNNPLAGQTLLFQIRVVSIRK